MLKYRIISGTLILTTSILCLLFLPSLALLVVGAVLIAFAQVEFYGLLKAGKRPHSAVLGVLLGSLYVLFVYGSTTGVCIESGGWLLLTVTIFAVLLWHLFRPGIGQPVESAAYTLLGVAYVPVLMGFMGLIGFSWTAPIWHTQVGRILLFFMVVVVKFSDIGAYTVGMAIGKHKMIPRISPGKSWEGFGGGILFSVLVALALRGLGGAALAEVLPWAHVVPLAVLLCVTGVVGDLVESMIKRAVGVKDSGQTIPGMGGLLDVLDSLVLAGPVMYAYMTWVAA